jgi:hypothetical protein
LKAEYRRVPRLGKACGDAIFIKVNLFEFTSPIFLTALQPNAETDRGFLRDRSLRNGLLRVEVHGALQTQCCGCATSIVSVLGAASTTLVPPCPSLDATKLAAM